MFAAKREQRNLTRLAISIKGLRWGATAFEWGLRYCFAPLRATRFAQAEWLPAMRSSGQRRRYEAIETGADAAGVRVMDFDYAAVGLSGNIA